MITAKQREDNTLIPAKKKYLEITAITANYWQCKITMVTATYWQCNTVTPTKQRQHIAGTQAKQR